MQSNVNNTTFPLSAAPTGSWQQTPTTGTGLTQNTWNAPIQQQPTIVAPVSSWSNPSVSNNSWTGSQSVPYAGTNNMMTPANGQFGNMQNQPLGQTPIAELELKKRMLENSRETQLKYADMESDKQKKFEDRAEKQREKAAKWKGRNMGNWLVKRHEKKAEQLEFRAHVHFMTAEDYKLVANNFENQRKMYDPPKDDKKGGAKGGKADDKKDSKDAKKDDKKDDKKEEKKEEKKDDNKPQVGQDAKNKEDVAKPQTNDSKPSADTANTSSAPADGRPKQRPAMSPRAVDTHTQDVGHAALRKSQENPQLNSAYVTGPGRA